jgi:hypothetical protein
METTRVVTVRVKRWVDGAVKRKDGQLLQVKKPIGVDNR